MSEQKVVDAVEASRAAQGFPARVEDPEVLRGVSRLLDVAREQEQVAA